MTELTCIVKAAVFGQWLFDEVISRLDGLLERDYFGLRYLDRSKQRQWLDLSRTVYKQLKNVSPRSLNFRVKHYPARPREELRQEKSRYLLYLQLRRDLHSGRLIGRNNDMHVMAALILQAEIGDYDRLEDYLGVNGSLADLKMFENMTPRVEAKIREVYKSLQGISAAEAEAKFLERASELETYGVEPVFVQDRKGNHFYVGLSHEGVTAFRGNRKAHVFPWAKIHRISYDGKLFVIQVEWEQRRHTLGFKCQTTEAAEALWKWAVDRQCFFTLNKSADAKKSKANGRLFRRRQLYSFTGRCQKEMLQMTSSMPNIPQPSVSRSRSLLNIAKSVSLSRQTKSQDRLHRSLEGSSNHLDKGDTSHTRSVSTDILTPGSGGGGGGVRLAGIASESADQLNRRPSTMANHTDHGKMYRSSEVISTSAPLVVTIDADGELSPAISTAWSPMSSQRLTALDEVASSEVERALSHAEIMRLVNHRQGEEEQSPVGEAHNKNSPSNQVVDQPARQQTANSPNTLEVRRCREDEEKEEEEEDEEETRRMEFEAPHLPSPTTSPRKLDRQDSVNQSPHNRSSTTSESVTTQVHRPQASTMMLEHADTVPSEFTPLSSSSSSSSPATPPSSPKSEVDALGRSVCVEPPSDFADRPSPRKDIYFPYLSKVHNLEREGGVQESLYQPLRFDRPTRDPFTLPSRPERLSVSVESSTDSAEFATGLLRRGQLAPRPEGSRVHAPPSRVAKSPLLLRHGYTPYRAYEAERALSGPRAEGWQAEGMDSGPRPIIVREGCAPPAEEPIVVAECYIPLCEDEEDDEEAEEEEEESENGLTELAECNKSSSTTFDWSAASTRVNQNLRSEAQASPRLPFMTTVVLSQEILPTRSETGDVQEDENRPGFTNANFTAHFEGAQTSTPRLGGAWSPSRQGGGRTGPVLQQTIIQASPRGTVGDRETEQRRQTPTTTTATGRRRTPTASPSARTAGPPVTSAAEQLGWLLLVFLCVHYALKVIRVGPVMGFYGATGPEAIGYWNALEAIADYIFFRLF